MEIGARRENKKVSEQLSTGKRGVGWEVAWRSGAVTYLSKLFCFSFWKYFVQKLKKTSSTTWWSLTKEPRNLCCFLRRKRQEKLHPRDLEDFYPVFPRKHLLHWEKPDFQVYFIIYIFLLHNPIYFIHCTITSWLQATLSRVVRGDSGGLNWGRNAFMRCTSMIPIRFFALARVKRARGQMLRSAPACCLAHIPSSCVGRCFSRTSPVPPETIGIVIQSFFRSKH